MYHGKTWQIDGQTLTYEQLHHQYLFVVKKAMRNVLMQGALPGYVDEDDLLQEGSLALIEAANRFDVNAGVKFKTFAQTRVYGAMVDHLRNLDWAPRTVRQKKKQIEAAEHALTVQLKRVPTHKEIAIQLGWSEDDLAGALARASKTGVLSLDLTMNESSDPDQTTAQLASTLRDTDPAVGHELETEEIRALIESGLEFLTEQEQKVFILHFIDHKPLKAITHDLNLSESRISQIRSKAILKMRAVLSEKDLEFSEHGVDLREMKQATA